MYPSRIRDLAVSGVPPHLLVLVGPARDGGVRDAVLGHHAANDQLVCPQALQRLVKLGSLERVGMLLDDDRGIADGGTHALVQFHAFRFRLEERRRAIGDVLD